MSVSTAHLPLPASPAQRLRNLVSRLGIPAAVNYLFRKRVALGRPAQYTLHPRRALHPLTVRAESSDIEVFHQIFIEEEYGGLDGLRGVDLVIDGGANVGYSAAYFLSIFPDCHVVAVEPEPGNYAILQKRAAVRRARRNDPGRDLATLGSTGDGRIRISRWSRVEPSGARVQVGRAFRNECGRYR